MKVPLKHTDGRSAGEADLPDSVFGVSVTRSLIYEAMRGQLTAKRQGTTSVKTVATVHGTTSKPWRQKGSGRARAGTNKSPLWRGGGVIFGPSPRQYANKLPRKVSQGAIASVLSYLVKRERVCVLEDFSISGYRTREVASFFQTVLASVPDLESRRRILYVVATPSPEGKDAQARIRKSASNLPWLRIVNAEALEVKDLYYADYVLLASSSLDVFRRLAEVRHLRRRNERADAGDSGKGAGGAVSAARTAQAKSVVAGDAQESAGGDVSASVSDAGDNGQEKA